MQKGLDYCAALVRDADRDRYLATLFAPAEHRAPLLALYAFNVEISRVREAARAPMPGEIRLQWWREALLGEREGEAAANPVAAALLDMLARYEIASDPLIALIDAHAFDLYDEPIATLNELEIYSGKTQGTLFKLAGAILAGPGASSKALIRHLGIAYTVVGILCALRQHALRRQLFLPLDVLKRHAVEPESIFAEMNSAALLAALAELRELVRRHLEKAHAEMISTADEMLPALLPAATIDPTLKLMDRVGYDPFKFTPLPAWRRQWLIWRAARNPNRIFRR
jgi:phytoene synthase